MIFSLEVLPAHKGDCLLMYFGEAPNPKIVIIDGGPAHTYLPHLRPRLEALRECRALGHHDSLPIEVLMVSHLDDDHIHGILEMTQELVEAAHQNLHPPFQVRTLWHNAFDDILGNNQIGSAAAAAFGPAALTGATTPVGLESDLSLLLASINQGRSLRQDADKLNWSVNSDLGPLWVSEVTAQPIEIPGGLAFHLVGPMQAEIEKLQKKHDAYLKKNNLGRQSAEAALAAFSDKSVPNLASLVVIASFGGKTILLTGDARGDKVLEGLVAQGLMSRGGSIDVDILKVMHHGSDNNVTKDFFEKVRAQHYVFSGDGKHGNPERACLEMLFDARPEGGYQLYFTYPIETIDKRRKTEAEYPWVAEFHDLATLFAEKKEEGLDVGINWIGNSASLRVDLLDRL